MVDHPRKTQRGSFSRRLLVEFGNRMLFRMHLVGQARGMGQQLVDGHRFLAFFRLHFTCLFIYSSKNLQVSKLRNKLRCWCVQTKASLFQQHQQSHTNNWLCHRIDPKDRILLNWQSSLEISVARPTKIGKVSSPPDQYLYTRQLTRFPDGVDQQVIQVTKPFDVYSLAS